VPRKAHRAQFKFREIRQRGRDLYRSATTTARRRLEPARKRVAEWAASPMVEEALPRLPGRPGLAGKITSGLALLLLLLILLFLIFFDWNYLRGPIGRWASARWDREVVLAGDLDVDLFRWSPRATVNDLTVGPPDWGPRRNTAEVERFTASVKAIPLLWGEVDMPEVRIIRPRLFLYTDREGRQSWQLGRKSSEPTKLPLMRRFLVEDGRIAYTDLRRRVVINATVSSRETQAAAGGPAGNDSAFRLEGRGTLNSNPLKLVVTGGPLINVRRDQPYAFTADLRGGGTTLIADGSITRPFDLGRFKANLKATGPDLADIYGLTTVPAPNTPPYSIRGRLSREKHLWRFDDFAGRVGDSDLSGDLSVRTGRAKPYLTASLYSRSLDVDDLFAVMGGPPGTGRGETASPEQRAMAARLRAQGRLLPDARLDVVRLRAMDADVIFRAGSVKRNSLLLTRVRVDAALKNSVLRLEPFSFTFSRGQLNGVVKIDGRKATPFTTANLNLSGYPLGAIIPRNAATGTLNARVNLAGSGASVRQAAANANGNIRLTVPGGQMRQAFAELMGINVGKGLSLLLSKDPKTTPIRCARADFRVGGGRAVANRIVIDTGVVAAYGSGTVNLANERMHLEIDGKSKKPRLLRVWAPITIDGPIRSPKLGVKESAVVKQAGLAAVLGAVIHPLAAILPFVSRGSAKDVDCAALMAG